MTLSDEHLDQIAQGFEMQREGMKLLTDGGKIIDAAVAALLTDLSKPPVVEPEPEEPEPPPVVAEPPPRPPEATRVITTTLTGLPAVLIKATTGDRIKVTKTKVDTFNLKNIVGPAVGITVDLTEVQIGNLQVNSVENVEFLGLDLNIAQVRTSKAIRFTRANVHDKDASGLGFYNCQGVVVTSSTFARLNNGIVHDHCDAVVVEGNSFREMTADGVTGTGVVGLRIIDNDFTDCNPSKGAHPDAIQLFAKNAKRASSDIVIAGNRILRGNGGIMQGIFITTQAGFEHLRYRNVTVVDNVVIGGMYQGINIVHADNVIVDGNTVQPISPQKSWIKVESCDNATVSNNEYNILTLINNTRCVAANNKQIDFRAA